MICIKTISSISDIATIIGIDMLSWTLLTATRNVPKPYNLKKYTVVTELDYKLYYHSAYDTRQEAERVAEEINEKNDIINAYVIGGYYD